MTKQWVALIFPSLLGLSLLGHAAALRWVKLNSSPSQTSVTSDLTSVAFILEEPAPQPPEPATISEPLPPEPLATPDPIQEEVLATEPEIEPSQPVPLPTPPPISQPPSPRPKPSPQPSLPRPVQLAPAAARSITIAKPDYARNPPPRFPEIARQKGWEGRVIVRATVNASGRVSSATLQQSSGFGALDQAALQAVREWKFIPRKENGTPQESVVEVPVNFNLRQK